MHSALAIIKHHLITEIYFLLLAKAEEKKWAEAQM
jgi:hypothetical protein